MYTAEVNADVLWGQDQRKKIEYFVQEANDLNEDMETLEKVSFFRNYYHLSQDNPQYG